MIPHILPIIPEHDVYTESFGGGLAIFFAKPPVKCEVVNDMNQELVNFYRVMSEQFDELMYKIQSTLHSRSLHQDAYVIYQHGHLFTPVDRAWAVWVLSKQGFAGQLSNSWGYDLKGASSSLKIKNAKLSLTYEYKKRLEQTTIECRDGLEVIRNWDSPKTFHYVDTPYFNSDCGHYEGYTESDFTKCLQTLEKVEGKFLLSNYPSDILFEFRDRNRWYYKEVEQKVAVTSKTNKMKIESLLANYDITKENQNQQTLFG